MTYDMQQVDPTAYAVYKTGHWKKVGSFFFFFFLLDQHEFLMLQLQHCSPVKNTIAHLYL